MPEAMSEPIQPPNPSPSAEKPVKVGLGGKLMNAFNRLTGGTSSRDNLVTLTGAEPTTLVDPVVQKMKALQNDTGFQATIKAMDAADPELQKSPEAANRNVKLMQVDNLIQHGTPMHDGTINNLVLDAFGGSWENAKNYAESTMKNSQRASNGQYPPEYWTAQHVLNIVKIRKPNLFETPQTQNLQLRYISRLKLHLRHRVTDSW